MKFTEVKDQPAVLVITLEPHVFGGVQAVEFTTRIRDFVGQGKRGFIVDLSPVEVMNSSGLGMLVSSLTTVRKFGAELVLAAVPEKIQRLLVITHLDRVFQQFPSVEEALKYFSQQEQ